MKSKIIRKHIGSSAYPCMMQSKEGAVVLFHQPGSGIVLVSGGLDKYPGHYSVTWNMAAFEPFNGSVLVDGATLTEEEDD